MRILVVEDEHRIANNIKKGLEQERFAVDIAYNGTDGYDLASTEDYDVIVLDLMLPGIDGLTICRKLRERNIHTPILVLTAKSQIRDKIEGLNTGADDYLTKPFSFAEFIARIRALSRRNKELVNVLLKVEDLKLDPHNFQVHRAGRLINLSKKEFSILEYMMRNPNKIITKDELIRHVWDYDADILPNTVEVNIKNLRLKVDNPTLSNKPLIHTVRGFGYKIGI